MINVIGLVVCYCRRKRKNNKSNLVVYRSIIIINCVADPQEQEMQLQGSSVNPQYENVPAPPQSVLSMKECAAYGVIEGTRF